LNLLDQLKECGFNPTGAIPSNLLQKCPLLDANKKTRRPEKDRSDATSGLIAVRWNDNSIVNVASNHLGVQPLTNVSRWSLLLKKTVTIPHPALITHNNRVMGGTDHMDHNHNCYQINIRNKKWWWSLFEFAIDTAVSRHAHRPIAYPR